MKKHIALILCILFICGALTRCLYVKSIHAPEPLETIPQKEVDPIPHREKCKFVDVIKSYDKEEHINGYSVKGRKYEYEGFDLLVLFVSDETKIANNIEITVDYLDEDGNTILTETQTFEGFAAGWKNYFVFYPRWLYFDSYNCTIEATPYQGIPYSGYLQSGTEEVSVIVRPEMYLTDYNSDTMDYTCAYTSLQASFVTVNFHSKSLLCSGHRILFDNQGEIYYIGGFKMNLNGSNSESKSYETDTIRLYTTNVLWENYRTEFEIPDELLGEISGITAFSRVGDNHIETNTEGKARS